MIRVKNQLFSLHLYFKEPEESIKVDAEVKRKQAHNHSLEYMFFFYNKIYYIL